MTWHGVSLHITAMGNNTELEKQNRDIELSIKEAFKFKHRKKMQYHASPTSALKVRWKKKSPQICP